MDLFIIRHAWAEQRGTEWPDDSLRPLTREGKDRFATMAALLVQRGLRPTVIATSPYTRCAQTAEILADQFSPSPTVVDLRALEPGSDLKKLIRWTSRQQVAGHEQIAWVGHAPDVDDLTAALLQADIRIRLAKGAIALLRFAGPMHREPGELRWLVTGKVLGC